MKKFLSIILAAAALMCVSCSKFDESEFNSRVSDLDERITTLESLIDQLNGDVISLQNLITATARGVYIAQVSETTSGYTILLSDGSTVEVRNGNPGGDGKSPVIGVREDTDGICYWTLDGQWLTDASGNKVSAESVTPQFRMSGVYLQVSYDAGKNWSNLCEITGGDSNPAIKQVAVDDDYVTFTLADNSTVSLPRSGSVMSVAIDEGGTLSIKPGAAATVNYTVSNAPSPVKVSAIAKGDWTVKVTASTATTGSIAITAPAVWSDMEILVFAYSKNLVAMTSIKCIQGGDGADGYYTVDLSSIDWTTSNVHYVKASSTTVAMVTKEYFGSSVDKQGIVVYPAVAGTPDYTKGFVAQLTLSAGEAASGDVHCGSVSFISMDPASVSYTAGTSAAASVVYVSSDGSAVSSLMPSGSSKGNVTIEPLTLVTDVKSHPCTKAGTAIWLANDFQTTKFVDGSSINTLTPGDSWPTNTAAKGKCVIIYDDATYGTQYLYSYWTLGYTSVTGDGGIVEGGSIDDSNFAPQGWHVPSRDELLTDLFGFMGGSTWENMCGQGLMNWNFNGKANEPSNTAASMLGYGAVWTRTFMTGGTSNKGYMCGLKPDSSTVNSPQGVRFGFCIRLIHD